MFWKPYQPLNLLKYKLRNKKITKAEHLKISVTSTERTQCVGFHPAGQRIFPYKTKVTLITYSKVS